MERLRWMGECGKKGQQNKAKTQVKLERKLNFLTARQITMIDEMLQSITPYGEVTLRVQHGRLRCIAKTKSYDAMKMQRPNSQRQGPIEK
jgi:hypothetical protein